MNTTYYLSRCLQAFSVPFVLSKQLILQLLITFRASLTSLENVWKLKKLQTASGGWAQAAALPTSVGLQDGTVLSGMFSGVVPIGNCKFPVLGLSSLSWRAAPGCWKMHLPRQPVPPSCINHVTPSSLICVTLESLISCWQSLSTS